MRYVSFSFKNFKGIEDVTIKLTGDVTTLIGLNESGKTTILEAIFCFGYGAEDLDAINPNLASLRNYEKWIPISERANFNKTIQISAKVELDDSDKGLLRKELRKTHSLRIHDFPDEVTIHEKYLFANSRYVRTQRSWNIPFTATVGQQRKPHAFESDTDEWQAVIAHVAAHLPRILYFPNFLFELPDRFDLAVDPDADEEIRDRDTFYRRTFDQILSMSESGANIDTHVIDRIKSENRADRRGLDAILLGMGRAVSTTIFGGWNRIFSRAPMAQEVEITADSTDDSPAFLELRIKGPDGYYDLSERSLGFRWFFMFLLMTSFYGENATGQKPLFLLDEPASNLHSSAQAELLKSFERLVDSCALVYTTHSHHMIDVRWLDSAYVVKNSALEASDLDNYLAVRIGSRTSISATKYRQFVAEHPDQQSYFQPVLDLLEYRPSTIEPTPSVVLVEGKSDFFLIRYMLDVIGIDGELKTVPGGGAGSLDPIIRLHIGWATDFVVLLDNDVEGRAQRDRYTGAFGPFVRNRCILLSEAAGDNAVIACESLLSPNEREAIVASVFSDADGRPSPKKAFRNAVIELYARNESLEISKATKARFESLVSTISSKLDGGQT